MRTKFIRVRAATCLRCGETWPIRPTTKRPKQCSRCKSPYWDKPRGAPQGKASPNYGRLSKLKKSKISR